jgi:hypothetical protein
MSNVFALTIRGTNFIPIFVGLVIFMAIAVLIMGYIGDISSTTSDSLNETTDAEITVMSTQFDGLYAEETTVHIYSEADPNYSAELDYDFVFTSVEPVDNFEPTGTWTTADYTPNRL